MKLILASDSKFLFAKGIQLLGLPKDQAKILHIITASKAMPDGSYIKRCQKIMKDAGYNFEEFDIEGKNKQELEQAVARNNVIYIEGGNTFYLLKAIKESNFDEIIKKFLAKGGFYAGTSAGAYVACPNIEVSAWGPKPKDRYGLNDFSALSLVPFLLKVHYTDDMAQWLIPKIKNATLPVRILRDGQGIFVDNNTYRFVGEGEEVKLS